MIPICPFLKFITYTTCPSLFSARLPPDEDPAVESGRVPRAVEVGEEVLARWSDEGWYYRGNVNLSRTLVNQRARRACARARVCVIKLVAQRVSRLFRAIFLSY